MKRTRVVYTAIFGNKDLLLDPVHSERDVDYICFTEYPERLQTKIWKVVGVKRSLADPVREARWYKSMPHLLFPDAKLSVWTDANSQIIAPISPLIDKCLEKEPIATFKHPLRNCIYQEAEVCAHKKKDDPAVIRKQVERYRAAGYPAHNGLISSGILMRMHQDKRIIRLMNGWWKEIAAFSKRDQLSFNYVAWEQKTAYSEIPGNISRNPYFQFRRHLRK